MSETKQFHIGDILSVTTGTLVSPEHVGGLYKLFGWLVNDDGVMTHQLPRLSDECEPFLRETFPDLAAVEPPASGTVTDEATCLTWLASLNLGEYRDVPRMPAVDHTDIDPLAELRMIRPDAPVVTVRFPDQS